MRKSLLVVLLAIASAGASAQSFPGVEIPIMSGSLWVSAPLAADVDLDGLPDLIALDTVAARIFVARGQPGGGFAAPVSSGLPINLDLQDLVVGQLDGDGWPDLALHTKKDVLVLHGLGTGAFAWPVTFTLGAGLIGLALGDANGDGRTDLFGLAAGMYVALADGAGGFLAPTFWDAGPAPTSFTTGDLDGDGLDDVLTVSNTAHTLAVTLALPGGGFKAPASYLALNAPQRAVIGRLDGDADADVLVVTSTGTDVPGFVQSWLNNGQGVITPIPAVQAGEDLRLAVLRDRDADGDLDVAVAGVNQDITVLENDGQAVLTPVDQLHAGVSYPWMLFLDATWGDGLADLLTAPGGHGVILFEASAPEEFEQGSAWMPAQGAPFLLDVARIDGDEWPDAVFLTTQLNVLLTGEDGLPSQATTSAGFGGGYPTDLHADDVDGDGLTDVILLADELRVGLGAGDGTFGAPVTTELALAHSATGLAIPDLDEDGLPDALVLDIATLLVLKNAGPASPGSFGSLQAYAATGNSTALAAGDLDGDGLQDAIVLRIQYQSPFPALVSFAGDGTGQLLAPQVSPLPNLVLPVPELLRLADVNLDGRLDAVVAYDKGQVVLALGDGQGGLQVSLQTTKADEPSGLAVGDVDGDGFPDVVCDGWEIDAPLLIRRGDGAGGLSGATKSWAGGGCRGLQIADLTLDGQPDLVIADLGAADFDGHVRLWPNVAKSFTWRDLGHGLPGSEGAPQLTGTGSLVPGSPGALHLSFAAPSATAALLVAPVAMPTPFKGGLLLPVPPLLVLFVATDAGGSFTLPWSGWPSAAPAEDWFFQVAVADAGAPHGVALSNALSGTEPD